MIKYSRDRTSHIRNDFQNTLVLQHEKYLFLLRARQNWTSIWEKRAQELLRIKLKEIKAKEIESKEIK